MRARITAPKRSSVAGITPPMSRSQTSVVVTSITPCSRPDSISFSIDWPPTPVAWKTRQSYSCLSVSAICCTHGVVTPNMVSPMAGSSGRAGRRPRTSRMAAARALTMPSIACAPLARIWREIELSPCTSVTEYIIMMSEAPT